MSDVVLVERADAIATVVLNRPEKLNALNKEMWVRLGEVIRQLSSIDELRCVVLRGAGDKAFAPGADIAEFARERSNLEQATAYSGVVHETMKAIRDCVHPTVALIKGICVGGGLEVASMCDIRICGESSRFGVPINRIGVTMAYPEIAALMDLCGRAVALEILLEARIFSAAEAREKGLVTRVVPDDLVEQEAYASAARIAAGAPLVNRWHKKFSRRLTDARPLTNEEQAEGLATFATFDFQVGYRAFLEKKTPHFEGR